jgi:hypothetical protein
MRKITDTPQALFALLFISFFLQNTVSAETLNIKVNHNRDDAEERQDNQQHMRLTDNTLDIVNTSNHTQKTGIRFSSVDIPKNATITHAFIKFTPRNSDSGGANLTIHAQDSENSTRFTSANHDISQNNNNCICKLGS